MTHWTPHRTGIALALIYLLAMMAVGCESIQDARPVWDQIADVAEPIAQVAAPATGGISTLVWTALAGIASAVFGINRAALAGQRKKVIQSIDAEPGTPLAYEQVDEPHLRRRALRDTR